MRDRRGADGRDGGGAGSADQADRARAADSIRPSPLSPAAVAELVRASLGDETEDEVCVECARTTAGNPLLARQLIAALEERDGERSTPARSPRSARRRSHASWPRGCERRSPTVGEVARALAILGDDASLADIAAVAGVDRDDGGGRGGRPDRGRAPASRACRRASSTRSSSRRSRTRSRRPGAAQLHLAAARELARDPARCERVAAHLLAGAARPASAGRSMR